MSKYTKIGGYQVEEESPLVEGETLLWSGKPKKGAFIINSSLTMMPFALLWLAFDSTFIISFIKSGQIMSSMAFFIIPFFALHLMPVWIWLGNIITAGKRWNNAKYYVTDKRIIIQSGFVNMEYQTIYYKDIRNVSLRMGIIDRMLRVGDIYLDLGTYISRNQSRPVTNAFFDIENPSEIYNKLQKIVLDIQTDIEFPNAYRPEENPGYNTKYDI